MRLTKVYFMLWARDMSRAVTFYRDAFGLEVRFQSPEWSELAYGDATIALHYARAEQPSAIGLGLVVDDLDDACRLVQVAGGRIVQAPISRPDEGLRLAEVEDTEGNRFSVGQLLPRT